jgi:hypothetical protein
MSGFFSSNFSASISIKITSGTGSANLLFRTSSDANSGYSLAISPGSVNNVVLSRIDNGVYLPLAAASKTINTNQFYTVGLWVKGSTLQGFVTDMQNYLIQVTDSTYKGGYFGVSTDGCTANFDSFSVQDIAATATIYKDNFWIYSSGTWATESGELSGTGSPSCLIYQGDNSWTDYSLEVTARTITAGTA